MPQGRWGWRAAGSKPWNIGTVVFPEAHLKIFLTADLKERAKRRLAQLGSEGGDIEGIMAEIAAALPPPLPF